MTTRQILLDTETTGLDPAQGHRLIEVAAVELVNRRFTGNYCHYYINPERAIDPDAQKVHGISNDFVKDKPLFADIAQSLWDYFAGCDLIIHNAPFDLGFLNHEFQRLSGFPKVEESCVIIDTLVMARQKHRGQKNNLDALCKRYQVDNSKRDWHGALIDAELLGGVYLAMTGGQMNLLGGMQMAEEAILTTPQSNQSISKTSMSNIVSQITPNKPRKILRATPEEIAVYQTYLQQIGITES